LVLSSVPWNLTYNTHSLIFKIVLKFMVRIIHRTTNLSIASYHPILDPSYVLRTAGSRAASRLTAVKYKMHIIHGITAFFTVQ